MARRAPSTATDDSQKENSGPMSQRNAHATRAKQERAAKNAKLTRIEGHDEEIDEPETDGQDEGEDANDDEEDEHERADDNEQGEGSSRGRKRARANSLGDSIPSGSQKGKAKAEPKILSRDSDGYIPGSIVRVRLENFVTYDWVEFHPGPYLNMILGPNGTGKSSIACALCLGLNFPTNVLGRASEIQSFVKIGNQKGSIEIELKGPIGKPNIVIKRTLNANSKSSQFFINNKAATGKEVNARIQELNIQVGNLCSFLPQDKVAEFARMTPQQLLRETQRAAGDSRLTSWHDALTNNGKELKQLQETLATDRQQLQTAEERNATLEREVKLYNERRNIEREIEFLELLLPFQQYREAKKAYYELKIRRDEMAAKVKQLEDKNAPISQFRERLDRQHKGLDEQRETKKRLAKDKYSAMHKHWARNEDLEAKAEEYKRRLDSLKREEKTRQKTLEKLEKDLINWQNELANRPETENTETVDAAKRSVTEKQRQLREQQEENHDRHRQAIQEEVILKQNSDNAQRRLYDLNNVDHQKLANLESWDKDCADTVSWLRQNKNRFKMEVFEPAILSVTVEDKRYASAIEACFSGNDLKTFVVQCEEDYQTLNRFIVDTPEALQRRGRINTWFRRRAAAPESPVSREELHSLGFDGYAMDFIKYPEGMDWFLQDTLGLHRTPVAASNPRAVNIDVATNALSRNGGVRYIVGNIMNQVSRSRYGQRLTQNATRAFGPGRHFQAPTIEPSIKRGLERQISEFQTNLAENRNLQDSISAEERGLREQSDGLKRELDAINARKQHIVAVQSRMVSLASQIESGHKRLERLRNAPSAEEERTQLKTRIVQVAMERAETIKHYENLLRQAIEHQVTATKFGLEYLQVGAKKIALENIFQAQQEELAKAIYDYGIVEREYKDAKNDSKTKLDISKAKLDAADDEVRAKFQQIEEEGGFDSEDKAVDVLNIELETKKAQLEMNMHTNAGVVEMYERRQAEIVTLSAKIESEEERSRRLENTINRLRDQWEPELSHLVDSIGEKFSAAFDRIGCAGQINIVQNEDFEKWAIEILVKFRDEEKLQPLTGERQSGGERSLTTILYLMSLTEHARAPFSLVDEINQGMDKRAERAVHNSLVDVTCKPDSGQYFLITPKLLPDLTYHERMKVLCVNNGEWIPEDHMTGNLMSMINVYLAARNAM